ncbi:hypothetical protein D0C16_22500 [Cellvibrio sp. KY-GH-1]|uniref:FG-GAP repeat protein n=1 Tax=Cellvibrio sp. KY-GH-1 TaxID=2303332 RepID=UPI001248C804|nr:FG-GAP repeat protein [Cellvibrio sp. KY-GH-1]QEY18502.1 hypothetical protein D0C16_22500 [Cellvibrio sp. KY-GH-1]
MNIDRFSPLFQRTTLLVSLLASSILLTACGGGGGKSSSSSSSSSISSSSRSSFSAASVPANGSGIWPSVKVESQNPKQLNFQWSPVEGATYYKLFKRDAASGGVTQVGGDLAVTQASDEIGVHVHDWVNSYYYVEACNAGGCQKSNLTFTATEMIKAIGYVKAPNGEAFDNFGWSFALSADGKTLAIGAPAEDSKAIGVNGDTANNDSVNAGAAYVFIKENGVWVQEAYLKASNTEQPNLNSSRFLPNDRFGYKVSISDDGNTLAVSALLEDARSTGINCNQDNYELRTTNSSNSSGDPSGNTYSAVDYNNGAVYVFTRSNKVWTQEAFVKSSYVAQELRFGETLALSGDGKTLAVGATSDSLAISGILMYQASSMPECLEYYPSSSSSSTSSSSSSSSNSSASSTSSSSSSNSAASAYTGGSGSGSVHIFIRREDGWMQQAYLKNSNAQQGDAFGASIAFSTDGNTLVIGAIGEDSQAKGVNGNQADNSCYYQGNDGLYVLDLGCEDAFYQTYGINNGAAYVFTRSNAIWTQEAYLKPASTFFTTLFGSSVDISGDGNTLVVGAKGDTTDTVNTSDPKNIDKAKVQEVVKQLGSGSAYVFARSGTTWAQEAYLKPSTITIAGEFGGDVSLSQDGNTLAVGSFREASNAKGVNGDEGDTSADRAGAVFVFTRANTVWTQKSYVKASNTDKDDRFGLNVDISGDGKTLAVGAHREAGRGYASATSVSSQASSSTSSLPEGALDQNDNSAEASGAVYLF